MIVSEREQQAWYQPWTFVRPWVRGFIGYSPSETVETAEGSGIYVVQLRGQERWQPQIVRPNLVDCEGGRRAEIPAGHAVHRNRRACGRHMARGAGRRPDPERRLRWRSRGRLKNPTHPVVARPSDRAKTKGQGGRPRHMFTTPLAASAHIPVLRLSRLRHLGARHRGLVLGYVRLGEGPRAVGLRHRRRHRRSGDLRADHLGLGPVRRERRQTRWSVWPPRCGRGLMPEVNDEIDHAPARYLGDLGTAAAAVASNLTGDAQRHGTRGGSGNRATGQREDTP